MLINKWENSEKKHWILSFCPLNMGGNKTVKYYYNFWENKSNKNTALDSLF